MAKKKMITLPLPLIRRTYQVRLDQDAKLKEISESTGAPEAWIIREALDQYFKTQEGKR